MKMLVATAALLCASVASAATLTIRTLSHPFTVRAAQQGPGFSVDLPIVGNLRGATTTFTTALDVTNNTPQSTDVEFLFTPADGSAPRSGLLTTLSGFDNLHSDDFLGALSSAGLIAPNQASNVFGSLLLTFTSPGFRTGTEATAIARISSAGSAGTVGLAFRARPIETNGPHSLSSIIRDDNGSATNIGIEDLGVDDTGQALTDAVTVQLSFFDPATGILVGAQPELTLTPGQVMQINDVFRQQAFQLPPSSALLLFVDEIGGSAQLRGYVVTRDTTNAASFVFMQESPNHTF